MRTAERWTEPAHTPTRTFRPRGDRTSRQLPDLDVAVLADGATVLVRRATERDAPELRAFYLGLSPATLYRRFMTPVPRLPESTLAYLCATPRLDREVVLATAGGSIVGEGRFHRLHGTDEAEVALVVADRWQGRGIGTLLAARLARQAARRGVLSFSGAMLADNDPARRLLGSVAPGAARRIRSGELEFRAAVPGP